MSRNRRTASLLLAATLAAGALAGCSSDGSDAAATTDPTTTEAATSAPPSTPTTQPPAPPTSAPPTTAAPGPEPCTTGATPAPAGAVSKEIVDVDGDGRPDTGWIAMAEDSTVTVGITTAAGGGATTEFASASPVTRSVLVANADEQGPVELFLDDGRTVGLDAFVDCAIVPITNPEGEPYSFGLGVTDVGTGIGCVDTDEGQRLAGLDLGETEGDTVGWSRTIVELDGTTAANGTTETGTYTRPADDARIELLRSVTCGDLTIADDGFALPSM